MEFDELASRAGRTAAEVGRQAEQPSFSVVVNRSRRRALAGRWSLVAVVILLFLGALLLPSNPDQEKPVGVTPTATTAEPTSTTTTLAKEPVQPLIGDVRETCPITIPGDVPFTLPAEAAELSLSFDGVVWYGTPEIWTFVQEEGQVWENLPADADGSLKQKTFWWTQDYVSSIEPVPDISFVAASVDGSAPTVEAKGVTSGGHPEMGVFIIAGFEIPQEGCWQITARYLDASVSYIAWVEGR